MKDGGGDELDHHIQRDGRSKIYHVEDDRGVRLQEVDVATRIKVDAFFRESPCQERATLSCDRGSDQTDDSSYLREDEDDTDHYRKDSSHL